MFGSEVFVGMVAFYMGASGFQLGSHIFKRRFLPRHERVLL